MSDIVIKVENVSKKYSKSFKRSMLYGIHDIGRNMLGLSSHPDVLRREEFWALIIFHLTETRITERL